MGKSRKSRKIDETIRKRYAKCISVEQLALDVGLSVNAVHQRASAMKIKRAFSGRSRTRREMTELKLSIMAEYTDCEDTAALAKKLGITQKYLHSIAHTLQVKRYSHAIALEEGNENRLYLEAKEPAPTWLRPGTAGKLDVLSERIRNREELFSDQDFVGGE